MRILTGAIQRIPGKTMIEKANACRHLMEDNRRVLMYEPRGHQGMCACIITESVNEHSHFGVIFMNHNGDTQFSGHGIVSVVTALVETGQLTSIDAEKPIHIDTEVGTIVARAKVVGSVVESVSFENVPSFVYLSDVPVAAQNLELNVDIAFGGAFYAVVDIHAVHPRLQLVKEQLPRLQQAAHEIKSHLQRNMEVIHPLLSHVNQIHGVIFYDLHEPCHIQNVTIFGDRQVNRSPSTTGASALTALWCRKGKLPFNQTVVHESVIGSKLTSRLLSKSTIGVYDAVNIEITGTGFVTGIHQFVVDPTDPLATGFLLK